MLHQDINAAAPVPKLLSHDESRVLAMLGWDYLPYELTVPGQGYCIWLLREDDADRAMAHLSQSQPQLDVLIVDEDFFGFPEDAADVCLRVRRMYSDIRIIGITSEMSDSGSVLLPLGLCDIVLPAGADAKTIAEELVPMI